MKQKVAIVHPWLPQYRKAFFTQLKSDLESEGIELSLFFGEPEEGWKSRGDQTNIDFGKLLPTREYKLMGKSLLRKSLKQIELESFDLIILEQAVRNLEVYELLLKQIPVAFWGHGKTYTQQAIWPLEPLKFLITNQGKWFFAYTQGGKDAVVSNGFPPDKVTVLNNTFDTFELRENLKSVTESDIATFRRTHDLTIGSTALYLGALDKSKRLDVLVEAAAEMFKKNSKFRLLIMGAGPERNFVTSFAAKTNCIKIIEPDSGDQKALALKSSEIITIPGRVGLVAVDSLVAGNPIVTTPDPFHPPEFEYLQPDFNCVVSEKMDAHSYSISIEKALEVVTLQRLSENALACADIYTLEKMIAAFVAGLKTALETLE